MGSQRTVMSHLAAGLSCAALLAPAASTASTIRVTLTVDNSYALFYGTATAATNFVGSDFTWPTAEAYNLVLESDKYLYVVTESDLSVAQGFLGQFENLDTGEKFYSNDPEWKVNATGLRGTAPYTGSVANLALLTSEIADANAGGNPSAGWVALTAGPANGAAPWGQIAGIDSAAKWVWYSSNGDPDPTTPGFDHDEWLVFRVPVTAVPSVPEPGSFAMLLAGLGVFAALGRARTRRRDESGH